MGRHTWAACERCGRRRQVRPSRRPFCADCVSVEAIECVDVEPYDGGWRVRGSVLLPTQVAS